MDMQLAKRSERSELAYSAEEFGPEQGPANPFKDPRDSNKRKNVLTGHAQEVFVSEHTFRANRQAFDRRHYTKEDAANIRAKRQKKGDATVAGEYLGPWAKYQNEDEFASDEYEEVEVDEEEEEGDGGEEEAIESGAVVPALPQALAERKEAEDVGEETTTFNGSEEYDYQGRTYMHVPQDLAIDLKKEVGSEKNYVPKKVIYTWKSHTKPICGLRFFPDSGHLLLSGSADSTVKIWDVYHQRELLRTYSGHSKALSDISFNPDGRQFLSASYDRQIKLWDTETGACINRFSTGKTPHVVRFNPSPEHGNEFLAGMSDKKIVQFDVRTRALVQEYDHHLAAVNTVSFVDGGRRFITTSDDKSLRAWDYNIPVPIKYVAEPYMYPLTRAALHPSGKYAAFQSGDNQIVVYGAGDKFRQNRKKAFRGHNSAGYAVDLACSPDGQFVASGDTGGFVCFWDWKTCKMWHKVQASDGAVTCVAWHPQESSKLVSAGLDGSIKYWD